MKSIFTKYLPATNHKGSRIKATDSDNSNSITIPYDYSLDGDIAHQRAAIALCNKMKWTGTLVEGSNRKGNVYVFVEDWNIIEL